jgi:HKD family nuclease
MGIISNIKSRLKEELNLAKSVWIATAMISNKGWSFLKKNIDPASTQFYLIGIDLATDPSVFEDILKHPDINARIYQTQYTFHPKVYLIQKADTSYTAFIGSSNTTTWGLEKNIEMNFQVFDQKECKKLLDWFENLYSDGYLITPEYVNTYNSKYKKALIVNKEVEQDAMDLKISLTKSKGQFFSKNEHRVFNEKLHRVNSIDLQTIRRNVRDKFIRLHKSIYPQFKSNGLTDLHQHHQAREIVSRHFFNPFSGNYINAIWLHYGKSLPQLMAYKSSDKSINKPESFINNIRMQVIIHEYDVGIWLVLGRNNGSVDDRRHLREQMQNEAVRQDFYNNLKKLGGEYWVNNKNVKVSDIKTTHDLQKELIKENLGEYFIIGINIDWLDARLSKENISMTVLREFKKLYPLYQVMRHR